MKYWNYQITFAEIPDEITLCINITNCPIHCVDCHSKHLWKDIGEELTTQTLTRLIKPGISCVCFMGGDNDYDELRELVEFIRKEYTDLKVALYSGRDSVQQLLELSGPWLNSLDYIKVGPYKKEYGGLDHHTTNQRLYEISKFSSLSLASIVVKGVRYRVTGNDITYKLQK